MLKVFFADFRIDFPTQYNYFLVTHKYFQNKISFFLRKNMPVLEYRYHNRVSTLKKNGTCTIAYSSH